MRALNVYQAEKNNSYYWFVAKSKKDIIELYPFLKDRDIFKRTNVSPDSFFRYVYRNELGYITELIYDEINNI